MTSGPARHSTSVIPVRGAGTQGLTLSPLGRHTLGRGLPCQPYPTEDGSPHPSYLRNNCGVMAVCYLARSVVPTCVLFFRHASPRLTVPMLRLLLLSCEARPVALSGQPTRSGPHPY